MGQMNISNLLWNDTKSGTIAYSEQVKDRSVDYSKYNKITQEIKTRFNLDDKFQSKLNDFFLYHYDEFHRFLEDDGVDPTIIDSWKEVQDFLDGLPDDETTWLKNKLTQLDNRITAMDIPDGGAYDVSADHVDGEGNYAVYVDLSTALAAVPNEKQKPGMSIRFIQGTVQNNDNKYIQARLMADSFTTDVTQWQVVDEEPVADSKNLVESGGVWNKINEVNLQINPETLTDVTSSATQIQGLVYNPSTNKIESGSSWRRVYYILASEDTTFEGKSNLSNPSYPVFLGVSSSIPAVDGTLDDYITINTEGNFSKRINVPLGKYFCYFFPNSYTTDIEIDTIEVNHIDLEEIQMDVATNEQNIETLNGNVSSLNGDVDAINEVLDGASAVNIEKTHTAQSGVAFKTSTKYDIALEKDKEYSVTLEDSSNVLPRGRIVIMFYDASNNAVNVIWDEETVDSVTLIKNTTQVFSPLDDVAKYALYTSSADTPTANGDLKIIFHIDGGKGLIEKVAESVMFTEQELTDSQKTQARSNIGAIGADNITFLYNHDSNAKLYDGKVVYELYSVIQGIPGNTEPHFLDGIERGFNALKADMRLSSDNVIYLCHDAGYTFDGNGRIIAFDVNNYTAIHSLTAAQIDALEFAEQYEGEYIHPCTLDTFLYLCKKYGIIPSCTLRWEEWRNTTMSVFYDTLKKYNLIDKVVVNLFTGSDQWATLLKNTDVRLMSVNTLPTSESNPEGALTQAIINQTQEWGCNYVSISEPHWSSITDALVKYAEERNVRVCMGGLHTSNEIDNGIRKGVAVFRCYSRTILEQI